MSANQRRHLINIHERVSLTVHSRSWWVMRRRTSWAAATAPCISSCLTFFPRNVKRFGATIMETFHRLMRFFSSYATTFLRNSRRAWEQTSNVQKVHVHNVLYFHTRKVMLQYFLKRQYTQKWKFCHLQNWQNFHFWVYCLFKIN